MHFAILGQTNVISDGERVPVSRTKRRVLSALLAAGDEGMSGEALVAAVWGDAHDRDNSLKSCISLIRRIVGADRLPLGTTTGYQFHLQPGDTFDVAQFRAGVAQAAREAEDGDRAAAVTSLREALALWGHPPLVDLPDETFDSTLQTIRADLLFERKSALATLFDLKLGLGQQQKILPDLRRELAHDPLAEDLHELLMRALYASGHRSEALRHYDSAVETLTRETGREPGAALRQVYAEIVADNVAGRPLTAAAEASAVAVVPQPAQLPPDIMDFTGREAEVRELVEALTVGEDATAVPVVGISGMGGVGKSALAIHVAHQLRSQFPDGQLFIPLAGMSRRPANVGEVLAELLASLGVPAQDLPASTAGRAGLLRSTLDRRRVLVVIDDAAGVHQAQPFLPGTAKCAVIITSRAVLAGGGARSVHLDPLGGDEALTLLSEIIGSDRIEREPEAATAVSQACGGLPLAVRIVGSRLRRQPHWHLSYFAPRLQDRLKSLADGDLAVSASIAESYEALPEEAKHAFRVLSLVGVGDWPMWLAGMLLGAERADEALETLTSHSLLAPAGVGALGHPRYRTHDLVREYGAQRLAEHPTERDVAMERQMFGWVELVSLADEHAAGREPYYPPPAPIGIERFLPAQARELIVADPDAWFASEYATILAVVRLICREGWHRVAYGVAVRVSAFLYRRNLRSESEDMWRAVMHAANAASDDWLADEARHHIASLIIGEHDGPERALPMLDLCVESFGAMNNQRGLARSLALRAACAHALARDGGALTPAAGQECADGLRGLEMAQALGDVYAELACLRAVGLTRSVNGYHESAVDHCSEAVKLGETIARESGEYTYQAWALEALITVRLAAGQYDDALASSTLARELARQVRDVSAEAVVVEQTGDALAGLGRLEEAAKFYGEAAAMFTATGWDRHQTRCQSKLAAASAS
ncbi:BTAD domain-containing putative transcriptional regulator [Streptosporangium sp. NPDC048865]|uniref:AfsR/SARP family transcriptional regulator n=1 Tax=Streptosporangium sp. NPDC048865 TaxID=3155766 RepID=UPI0034392BD0